MRDERSLPLEKKPFRLFYYSSTSLLLLCRPLRLSSITLFYHPMKRQREVAQRLSEGQTAIVVAAEGKPVGLLFSSDTVRPAAAAAVASLVQRGLTVRVASGDRREAVWTAAAAAGVPREDTTWAATPGKTAVLLAHNRTSFRFWYYPPPRRSATCRNRLLSRRPY